MSKESTQSDLRSHLTALKAAGERVVHVDREVSTDRELTAIVKLMEPRGNPVAFFDRVAGSSMPVVVSVNGTRRRIALALGCEPDELTDRYLERIAVPIGPREVEAGPIKDVRIVGDDVDLAALPIVTHAARDAGPYLSSGVGLAVEPESGATNAGIYRMGLKDRNHFTVNADARGDLFQIIHRRQERGMPLEFVVVLGHHPALMISSQADIPIDEDTLALTGAILGQPLEMVPGESIEGRVPAAAEIVLEGHFLGTETELEGPFGEFPYYYSSDQGFIFEVTAITHRSDAIFQDIHNVHPEHRNLWIIPNREAELLSTLRGTFEGVKACHIVPASAGMHAYVSVQTRLEGEAKRVIMLALGSTPYLKQVVALDPDINIWDVEQVQWAIATRSQADRDWFTVPYTLGYGSDPSSYAYETRVPRGGVGAEHDNQAITTAIGIDATMPVQFPFAERADLIPEQFADIDIDSILEKY